MRIDLVTTLRDAEAERLRAHVAFTFDELERRLGKPHDDRPTTLYVFHTPWQYMDFLRSLGMDGAGSGGVYFRGEDREGIATFTRGFGHNRTLANLQHEAFHCYADRAFPQRLPIWLNEGLAQYFEDALVLDGRLRLGPVDTWRLAVIRSAATDVPLKRLLELDDGGWHGLRHNPLLIGCTYATAWSFVRFLITANSPWRQPFADTLRSLRRGADPKESVVWLLDDATIEPVRAAWLAWLESTQADPLSTALDRLILLANLLKWLAEVNQRMPRTIDEFRARMRLVGMEVSVLSRAGAFLEKMRGDNPRLFADPGTDDREPFELIPGASPRTPPQIRSTKTPGQPVLSWFGDRPKDLDWRVDFTGPLTLQAS